MLGNSFNVKAPGRSNWILSKFIVPHLDVAFRETRTCNTLVVH